MTLWLPLLSILLEHTMVLAAYHRKVEIGRLCVQEQWEQRLLSGQCLHVCFIV